MGNKNKITRAGRKTKQRSTRGTWCSYHGLIHDRHLPYGCNEKDVPKESERLVRCPDCGKRVLIRYRDRSGYNEWYPEVYRHKRRK